jgi:hypothetical protein
MKLTINSVEQKTGKNGVYYQVETDHGKFSSSEDLRVFQGKTAEFNTAVSQDGKYNYINKPLPEIPKEPAQSNGSIAKEKLMILSYAKDFAGFYSPALSTEDGLKLVDTAYKKMCEIIGIKEEEEAPF